MRFAKLGIRGLHPVIRKSFLMQKLYQTNASELGWNEIINTKFTRFLIFIIQISWEKYCTSTLTAPLANLRYYYSTTHINFNANSKNLFKHKL